MSCIEYGWIVERSGNNGSKRLYEIAIYKIGAGD